MAEPGTVLPVCERLLHMVNTHHAIKDCAAMSEAADTMTALYNALFDAPLPSTMDSVETHYKLFYDWYNNVAQPALSLALGEQQDG